MMLPKGTNVAVADGEKLNLFRNSGDEANLKLTPVPRLVIGDDNPSSGSRQNSPANPDQSQASEDDFSANIVESLNKEVLEGTIDGLVIIAAPRARGNAQALPQGLDRQTSWRDCQGADRPFRR